MICTSVHVTAVEYASYVDTSVSRSTNPYDLGETDQAGQYLFDVWNFSKLLHSLETDCHRTRCTLLSCYSRARVVGLVIYRFSTQALALLRGSMTKALPDEEDEIQASTKVMRY